MSKKNVLLTKKNKQFADELDKLIWKYGVLAHVHSYVFPDGQVIVGMDGNHTILSALTGEILYTQLENYKQNLKDKL